MTRLALLLLLALAACSEKSYIGGNAASEEPVTESRRQDTEVLPSVGTIYTCNYTASGPTYCGTGASGGTVILGAGGGGSSATIIYSTPAFSSTTATPFTSTIMPLR